MKFALTDGMLAAPSFARRALFLICGQETSPSLKYMSLKKRGMWRKNNFFLGGIFMINWEINRKRQQIEQDRQ